MINGWLSQEVAAGMSPKETAAAFVERAREWKGIVADSRGESGISAIEPRDSLHIVDQSKVDQ